MEIITWQSLIDAAPLIVNTFIMMRGILAAAMLQQVALPFSELSVANILLALFVIAMLWRNKSLVFSGLSYMLHMGEWLADLLRGVRR